MAGKESQGSLIDPSLGKQAEWLNDPEAQAFFKKDQASILQNPYAVHVRFILSPSNFGKTMIAAQMAWANENDPEFNRQLQEKTQAGRKFLGIHVSLSHALELVAEKAHISKKDINEDQRKIASGLMIKSVLVARHLFSSHPSYTVGMYIDTVGITESDLGTSAVRSLRGDPYTRVFVPQPYGVAETRSRRVRQDIAEHTKDQTVDPWLEQEKGIVTGTIFGGNAEALILSSGDESAWKRHWQDIFKQVNNNPLYEDVKREYLKTSPTEEQYMSDQALRMSLYKDFIPLRLHELGFDGERAVWVPNQKELSEVHTHFSRLYGKTSEDPETTRHRFPLKRIANKRKPKEYMYEEFAQIMGL